MTQKLEFAKGLSLPADAATQTFGFIARKRAYQTKLEKPIKVLDHGYVQFVGRMGYDETVIEAARERRTT